MAMSMVADRRHLLSLGMTELPMCKIIQHNGITLNHNDMSMKPRARILAFSHARIRSENR